MRRWLSSASCASCDHPFSLQCQSKSLEQQSRRLGEILVKFDQAGIPCWHLDAQPGEIRWIVSQRDSENAQALIETQFSITEVENHAAIVSLVGNRETAQAVVQPIDAQYLGVEILSDTGHAVRLLAQTNDMVDLLHKLSQHCELKHAVQK